MKRQRQLCVSSSSPGTGARNAIVVAQLYFRLVHFHPLTVMVVDALSMVFGADGATVDQLVDYLGVSEKKILSALLAIPPEMRCSSRDLQKQQQQHQQQQYSSPVPPNTQKEGGSSGPNSTFSTALEAVEAAESEAFRTRRMEQQQQQQQNKRGEPAMVYFLNYKVLLPIAYAHVCRLLLRLCVLPLETESHTTGEGVKGGGAGAIQTGARGTGQGVGTAPPSSSSSSSTSLLLSSSSSVAVTGEQTVSSSTTTTTAAPTRLLSSALQRRVTDIREGVLCRGCQFYFDVDEILDPISSAGAGAGAGAAVTPAPASTYGPSYPSAGARSLTICPVCGDDVLRRTLGEIQTFYTASLRAGVPLLTPAFGSGAILPPISHSSSHSRRHRPPHCHNDSDDSHNNNKHRHQNTVVGGGGGGEDGRETNMSPQQAETVKEEEEEKEEEKERQEGGASDSVGRASSSASMPSPKPFPVTPSDGTDTKKTTTEDLRHRRRPNAANAVAKAGPAAGVSIHTAREWPQTLRCPLARDPPLVQQALLFLHLFSTTYACLNDEPYVVDPNEILTQPELERRQRGGGGGGISTDLGLAAEQFRAAHRHAKSVRVRLVSSAEEQERQLEENWTKLQNRAHLPPWMRPPGPTILSSTPLPTPSPVIAGGEKKKKKNKQAPLFGSGPTASTTTTAATPAQMGLGTTTPLASPHFQYSGLETARFVLEEFGDDDYEEVPLPLVRLRLDGS